MTTCTTNADCSNHGQCINSSCECDPQYMGAKCDACLDQNADYSKDCACNADYEFIRGECIATACMDSFQVVCTNQGHCIAGKCKCQIGVTGDLCTDCDTSKGLFADTPLGCLIVCKDKCRQYGYTCSSGIETTPPNQLVCSCANENFDPRQACQFCKTGYVFIKGECVSVNCVSDGAVCGHHGLCVEDKCECFEQYQSHLCEDCVEKAVRGDNYCLIPCTAAKTCMSRNHRCADFGDVSGCTCRQKNDDPDHNCIKCIAGYIRTITGCQPENCVIGYTLCSNNGTCTNEACVCEAEYEGDKCEYCADGRIETPQGKCVSQSCLDRVTMKECAGNGICKKEGENYGCVCNVGYQGIHCSMCSAEFVTYNNKCYKKSCFAESRIEPCSNNGRCMDDGTCSCNGNAEGKYCEKCTAEYGILPSGACIPLVCYTEGTECNGKGMCIQFGEMDAQCGCNNGYDHVTNCSTCKENWYLVSGDCANKQCVGRMSPLPCSGNGTCQEIDFINDIAECYCNAGFKGRYCDECDTGSGFVDTLDNKCANKACVGRDGYTCSGNGDCFNYEESLWECRCGSGATGKFCTDCNEGFQKLVTGHCIFETCVVGGLECNGKGLCREMGPNHRCICKDGFDGQTNCTKCMAGYVIHENTGTCIKGGDSNKLSGGAIAGIVIGVILFLVAIGLVVFFILKKKGGINAVKSKNNVPKDMQSGQKFSI